MGGAPRFDRLGLRFWQQEFLLYIEREAYAEPFLVVVGQI